MSENDEELRQLLEIKKMMLTPGWGFLVQMWGIQREAIIKKAKEVNEAGGPDGWRAQQGMLNGFDKAVLVAENMRIRYEETEQQKFEEEKEKQEARNAERV